MVPVGPPAPANPLPPPGPFDPPVPDGGGGGGVVDGTNETLLTVKLATQGAVTPSVGTSSCHWMLFNAAGSIVGSGAP